MKMQYLLTKTGAAEQNVKSNNMRKLSPTDINNININQHVYMYIWAFFAFSLFFNITLQDQRN